MNMKFKSVYSAQTGTWVAIAENAKSQGKKTKAISAAVVALATGMVGFSGDAQAVCAVTAG
jgi:hypothetical protein